MDRKRKRQLRELNARAWAGEADVFPIAASLDSSMKKNTAFIRRLRAPIGAAATASIIQEIHSLSLNKYLSEIISACYEGLTKLKLPSDIAIGVEVFSALHQRFGPDDFTSLVGWLIGRGLSTPDKSQLKALPQEFREKEEKERLARHKVLLRVATELWLVGALRSLEDLKPPEDAAKTKENSKPLHTSQKSAVKAADGDAEPFPLEVLKEMLGQDGHHVNLPMVAQYFKTFSWDLLGKSDAETEITVETPMTEPVMQQRFKNVVSRYFEGAKLHLVREQNNVNTQGRRNAEAYVRSGEIFEDRQAGYEKMVKAQEKFVINMQMLAECLETSLPDLNQKDGATVATDGTIGLVNTGDYLRGEGDGAGIWDDEDERRFYENLIDLKDRVPNILLDDAKKKKTDGDEEHARKSEELTKVTDAAESAEAKDASGTDLSTAIANKTVGAQVDALLARLPEVTNKEAIDEIAVDFCFVNSKASRNRLIRAVQDVPRARSDLLPMYSRLVTTLGKYMPDISQSLVSHLDDEFRSLQRRKQKDSLGGVRTSNIRYLAELTKFGVVPEHVIFHCLKVSLDEFSKMNIEIICNLLENCGRYLLRYPESAPRMRSFLDTLIRKKSAQHLGQQERMLIENATYTVDPPQRSAIQQKERTPLDLFVRELVYMDLNKRNVERIIKQIRKLHWEEDEVVETLRKVFVKPARIRYSNIHFLAIILGSLNRYHQDFSISVIDDLLESITLGLELNDFKFNQRRLAEVRYLGELYVYRMIDSSIIFDTMYRIVTYGHGGWPRPGIAPSLDAPDDYFRIRLICGILETCGTYYNKGASKKKLDFFLIFFQYYIHTKEPMPMDIDFAVQDAFSLVRFDWKFAKTLEEAGTAFAEACKDNNKNAVSGKTAELEDMDGEPEDGEDDGDLDGRRTPSAGEDKSSSDDEAEDVNDDHEHINGRKNESSDEDEHIVVTRPEDERDPEADADFDRELAKMMAESVTETRKTDRKTPFHVALPMRKPQRDTLPASADDGVDEIALPAPNMIQFSLLSKRGTKPQTRNIDLPADSSFAVAHRTQREVEKAEQQRIKALVLNYNSATNNADSPAADTHDGESHPFLSATPKDDPFLIPNPNHARRLPGHYYLPLYTSMDTKRDAGTLAKPTMQPPVVQGGREARDGVSAGAASAAGMLNQQGQRPGGGGGSRRQQQSARKLQLSDVDWYGDSLSSPQAEAVGGARNSLRGRKQRSVRAA